MKKLMLSCALALAAATAHAAEPQTAMIDYVNETARAWFADPVLQDAILQSNAAHAGLSEAQLIELDDRWRAEIGQRDMPTIEKIVNSPAAEILRAHAEQSGGIITEIILMDNRGMNVAVSAVTSDFWQGDEAKYQETFPKGTNAFHVSEIELDESSQTYQAQASFIVADPHTGAAIGVVTMGLNAEAF